MSALPDRAGEEVELTAQSGQSFAFTVCRPDPGAPVLPTMMTFATDMAQLRAKGIQSYGIGPPSTEDDLINYGFHSDVERLSETSLYSLAEFTWNVTMDVATTVLIARWGHDEEHDHEDEDIG